MKRIIYILLIMTLILSLCACGKKDKNTPTQELGEPVGDTAIFNEDSKQYTSENLPKEYENNDFDGDRIKNKDEIKNGTNMYKVDTDGDGISDYDEIKNTKTDPTKWSSRDDDVSDLEYSIINNGEFKEGYTSTDANTFKVYLAKAEDR